MSDFTEAVGLLKTARYPLLLCHRSPDGDTLGAAIGLAIALRRRGGDPVVACPDPLPPSLTFMPEAELVRQELPNRFDLLVTVDVSEQHMLGRWDEEVARLRDGTTFLNIDHHASDTRYADVNLVDSEAASTAEIVFEIIRALDVPIDKRLATALMTGIINDTHSFQNDNSSARALRTAAALVEAGADTASISRHVLLGRRPEAVLLWGYVLSSLHLADEGRVASAVATPEVLASCRATVTDLDGIVEFLRNINGVDLAFLLKGTAPDQYKASIRTSDRVDAILLTAPFGGGGHHRAAGCDLYGTAEAGREALLTQYRSLVAAVE